MNYEEEINTLKSVVNNLFVQHMLSSQKEQILFSLFFDFLSENHPDKLQKVYTDFVNRFETVSIPLLSDMEKCLFDIDPVFLIRQKLDLQSEILQMKNHGLYLSSQETSD